MKLRPLFIWNWKCWAVWYLWESRKDGITRGLSSLGPLGIYWQRQPLEDDHG